MKSQFFPFYKNTEIINWKFGSKMEKKNKLSSQIRKLSEHLKGKHLTRHFPFFSLKNSSRGGSSNEFNWLVCTFSTAKKVLRFYTFLPRIFYVTQSVFCFK